MPFRGNDENELLWNVCYEQIHYPMFLSKELTTLLQSVSAREIARSLGATCAQLDRLRARQLSAPASNIRPLQANPLPPCLTSSPATFSCSNGSPQSGWAWPPARWATSTSRPGFVASTGPPSRRCASSRPLCPKW